MAKLKLTFTFNGVLSTLESNDEGFFDLYELWRKWNLKRDEAPVTWRTPQSQDYTRRGWLVASSPDDSKVSYLANWEALSAYCIYVGDNLYYALINSVKSESTKKCCGKCNKKTKIA